jgi:hypothetical protein
MGTSEASLQSHRPPVMENLGKPSSPSRSENVGASWRKIAREFGEIRAAVVPN